MHFSRGRIASSIAMDKIPTVIVLHYMPVEQVKWQYKIGEKGELPIAVLALISTAKIKRKQQGQR